MAQELSQLSETPPLSGPDLVQGINKIARTLGTDFAGPIDPGSLAWAFCTWADTGTQTRKRRTADNTAWVIEGRLFKNHMPIFQEADIPTSDIGPVYVIGKGTYEWSGTAYVQIVPSIIDTLAFRFVKADENSPAFEKTSSDTISIKAGSALPRFGVVYDVDTAVTMPVLVPGTDYSIWAAPDGALQAVEDKFITPATPPVTDAIKIGGFHYSLVAPGTTPASGGFSTAGITSGGGSFGWTQADVDMLTGINEFSIWDLTWRCKGEQRGMTFDPLKRAWFGIYFMSDSPHIHGPSAYNTNVASGTVLPYIPEQWGGNGVLKYSRLSAFEAHELVSAFGLRLITYDEFMSAAFGVTEGQSLGGAAVTIAATARQPGYTSRIGLEQATGHIWVIGGPIISSNGSAYAAIGRGSWYGTTSLVLLGGARASAADSGSRAATFYFALSNSDWNLSVRAAGDHLNLGRAAR